jgi:TonB family protein
LFAGMGVIRVNPPLLPEQELVEMAVVYDSDIEVESEPPREFELGERDAKGYASHPLDGPREAVARQARTDQAELSLDPRGSEPVSDRPAEATDAAPTGGTPILAAVPKLDVNLPIPAPSAQPQLEPPAPLELPEQVAISPTAPPPPPPMERVDPIPGASPTEPAAADPAPESDSESDAFSTLGTAEFRDGRFTVRSGRKVKTRRPKIGLAGAVDVMQRRPVQVVLNVEVDAAGKVTKVDVLRSSGTNEIDQPCKVAMYEWWFEPRTDASGRAVPDKFHFAIGFP